MNFGGYAVNPLRLGNKSSAGQVVFNTLLSEKTEGKDCEDVRSLKLSFDNGLPCDLGQKNQEFQKLKDIYVTKLHLFKNKDFSSLKNEK